MKLFPAVTVKGLSAALLYAGFAVNSAFALVLDFSDNPSGESWKRIWSGEYSLNAGIDMHHGDSTFLVDDAVTLIPGSRTGLGTETITLSRGGNHLDRFNLRSFDVAMRWTGDPGAKPVDFGDYFYVFMTALDSGQRKQFHVDTWDTYTHIVLDDPMEAIFIGFWTYYPQSMLRLDNIEVLNGPLGAPPIPEPSTYAMMLAGLGWIAWLGRKQQRVVRHAQT